MIFIGTKSDRLANVAILKIDGWYSIRLCLLGRVFEIRFQYRRLMYEK